MPVIGRTLWAIPEGYIPSWSNGPDPQMVSHETVCLLNAGDEEARIEILLYYEDREPIGPYRFIVPPRRSRHLKFNDFTDPEPVPVDKPFSSVVSSSAPIVVQHSRLDSRQAENALMTSVAFPGEA